MSDRLPGSSYDNPIWYGKWRIYASDYVPMNGCQYSYVHDNYDGAPNEPFGPPADNRCGYGKSVNDCIDLIKEYEDEHC